MRRTDFPTDVYIGRSVAELLGRELVLLDTPAVDRHTAVLVLSQVDFRTGALLDPLAVTSAAHRAGALALWDLSHSAGALAVDLTAWDADLAVGCGYKYLSGGPGAPAWAYVARRHHAALRTPLPGWFGHAEPFAMSPDYAPAPGVGQLACGTPPVLSLLALEQGLSTLDGASPGALQRKARALTALFAGLVARWSVACPLASPVDPAARGAQVALRHPRAYPLVRALAARGVVADFREPDLARFGFAPAYTRFVDAWDAAAALRVVLDGAEHTDPRHQQRAAVT